MIIAARSESTRSQRPAVASRHDGEVRPALGNDVRVHVDDGSGHEAQPFPGWSVPQFSQVRACLALVEGVEQRREVGDDVADLHLDLVDHGVAFGAVPPEALQRALLTDPLDDEPDRPGLGTLRRMRQVARQHPHLALVDVDPVRARRRSSR